MGVVGPVLAEILGLPFIALVKEINVLEGNLLKVKRIIPDGYQVFEVSPPVVLTISNDIGLPRLPTGMGIISSMRTQIPVWNKVDLKAEEHRREPVPFHNDLQPVPVDLVEGHVTGVAPVTFIHGRKTPARGSRTSWSRHPRR